MNDAGLKITEGGVVDEELRWALDFAERIDPLTEMRKNIEQVQAQRSENALAAATDEDFAPTAEAERPKDTGKDH